MNRTTSMRMVFVVLALLGASVSAQPTNEQFARRQYDSGMSFLGNNRYEEALKDLQAVVDSFPTSSIADDALLQIAQLQLENAHDLDAAQLSVDKLLKEYPDGDAAPMAHVLSGRISFGKTRSAASLDSALASYERVPRLFPRNDAVAAAGYFAGETLRTARRETDALDRYRRVSLEFPRSTWAARACLSAGYCLIQQGKPVEAVQEFQRARQLSPGSSTATTALELNSIAYRLYLRAPAQPAFAYVGKPFGPERSAWRDVVGLAFNGQGQLMVGHRTGVSLLKADGSEAQSLASSELTAFFIDEQSRIVVARQGTLVAGRAEAIAFAGANADGVMQAVGQIAAVLPNDQGERLIANPKGRTVIRSMPNGRFVSVFASGNITRLAQNWRGDVAMLDVSARSVAIADRDGKVLSKIPSKGTGYEFGAPTDIAFDALGHLYVLDRKRSAVFVFGAKSALVTTLTAPEKSPGALSHASALTVDGAGRLYVFDEASHRIQVYQ